MNLKFFSVITFILINLSFANAASRNEIYSNVSSSIYQLYAVDKDKETLIALGSSVAITKHYLATNCHVALAGSFLIVKVDNNPYLARLCYFNREQDLCIIDVVGIELSPAHIRPTKDVKIGEDVYALAKLGSEGKLVMTQGIVEKAIPEGDYITLQSNAKTTFGSSGGGLFDHNSFLIGLTTSGTPGTNIGYSIPTELILEVINPKNLPKCMLPH